MYFKKLIPLLVLIVSFSVGLAQSPQSNFPEADTSASNSDKAPVFKRHAEVVLVPVVVRDKKGKPVTALPKDVFQVEENGKPRAISSFEEVVPESGNAPAVAREGYTNIPLDASLHTHVTIAVLDLINTNELQRTDGKEQLIRFFTSDMPPGEPVSLLCLTKDGVMTVHPFTSDPATLVKSLQDLKVEGHTLGQERDIARETLRQIREIASAYAGVPGRKSMLLFAGDLLYPETPNAAFGGAKNTAEAGPGTGFNDAHRPGPAEFSTTTGYGNARLDVITEFEDTWASLLSANIAVYPMGLLAASADLALHSHAFNQREQTLRYFADRTGGILCKEDNGLSNCLNTAIEDSRSYYLLTYALPEDDRKPGWRKLKVKVNAKSVEVRAREGFYYGPPDGSNGKPAKPHQDEINALASALAVSDVPMNVRVLPASPASGGKITQHFLITVPMNGVTIDASLNPALNLEVGAIALDKKVKDAGEFLHPLRGNPNPDTLKQFANAGISWPEKLDLAPGAYNMRFVVRDNATGKLGTVVFPLEVK